MNMERRHDLDRIIQDPAIMVGKPVVKGTRIPVERVIQHLAENPDLDDLFQAFPHLTLDDVKACLAYAHATLAQAQEQAGRLELATTGTARA